MSEQNLRRFLSDTDDDFSFPDCSQLGIREVLRWKRRRTIYRVAVLAASLACLAVGWRATVSHEPKAIRPAIVDNISDHSMDTANQMQRISEQLASLRESLSQERKKMGELQYKLTAWNDHDLDVAESTSLVDVSYAFHLQNNVGQVDLATKEFERITRESPGTSGATIAAESLIASKQP